MFYPLLIYLYLPSIRRFCGVVARPTAGALVGDFGKVGGVLPSPSLALYFSNRNNNNNRFNVHFMLLDIRLRNYMNLICILLIILVYFSFFQFWAPAMVCDEAFFFILNLSIWDCGWSKRQSCGLNRFFITIISVWLGYEVRDNILIITISFIWTSCEWRIWITLNLLMSAEIMVSVIQPAKLLPTLWNLFH